MTPRTAEDIIRDMLGRQAIEIASLAAKVETLQALVADLEHKLAQAGRPEQTGA